MGTIGALAAGAALLAAAPVTAGEWQVTLTPYLMIPTMDGKAAVGPLGVVVNTTPATIFSHLNWGAMGQAEVNNGRWGVNLDATYMNVDVTSDTRRYAINGHQGAYTATLLYRVHPHAELYAGARVNDIGLRLDCNRNCLPLDIANAARGRTWVDPLVGVRTTLPFSDHVDLTTLADVGGFGAASAIAVQAWPSLGVRLGPGKAMAGYRLLYTKYQTGAGRDRFVYDVVTYGPTIGYQLHF
jgi:hypothetical protein